MMQPIVREIPASDVAITLIGDLMTTLVAIGFAEQTTASAAAEHIRRSTPDIVLDADAVAVMTRDEEGTIHVTTSHQVVTRDSGTLRGVFWLPLFTVLCFIPLLHMPTGGEWQVLQRQIEATSSVVSLRQPILEMLQPGASILFLAIGPTIPVEATADVQRRFGGSLVSAELSAQAEDHIRQAFHGASVPIQ